MIFTLVKNELIKIFSRAKTWIVFGLFAIFVIGIAVINYKEAKNYEYYYSPQGQIEMLSMQKERNNEDIEHFKSIDESWAKDEIESINMNNQRLDKEIEDQKKLLENKDDTELWKSILNSEKEEAQKVLNEEGLSEKEKEHYKERIDEIDGYIERNQKPIESWEFDGINFGTSLVQTLGIIILVSGIAVFMSDIVSGESTPPTLKFLLVQPITRGKVILSKFIAVVVTVVGLIGGLELIVLGIVGAIAGFDGAKMPLKVGVKYMWDYNQLDYLGMPQLTQVSGSGIMSTKGEALLEGFALQVLFIIACCAFIFLISAIFKSSMTTMALSVITSVASTMSCMVSKSIAKAAHLLFFNYGSTLDVITGDITHIFNNPNFDVGLGIVLMCVTIVVSYVLAHIIFSKKDILV